MHIAMSTNSHSATILEEGHWGYARNVNHRSKGNLWVKLTNSLRGEPHLDSLANREPPDSKQ